MIYSVCLTLFLVGVLGLVTQALLGMGHAGHFGGHASAGHGPAIAHGAPGHSAAGHHAGTHTHGAGSSFSFLDLLSPLAFFSLCVGAGATGVLLKSLHLAPLTVALAATAGAIVFYAAIIRPMWDLLFRFASTPSSALEGAVAAEAEVLTKFDATGKALVRLNVDGQLVRVLASLEPDGHTTGADILPGERLVVVSVDGHNNTCRVARL